jgi:MFS family permease
MIWMDILRVFACLLPLMSHSRATLGFAFAGVIVISLGSSIFEPAAAAALPNLVDNEDLSAANVLFGSTWGTMLAVGAAIGGAVTAQFGRNVSFISDAVSFGISALLIYSISGKFAEDRKQEHPPLIRSARETFQYAKKHRRVLALLVSKGGYGIGAGVVAMLSVFGREVFKAGAFGIGLLFAARGVGALLGPFIARGVSRTNDEQYRLISWSVLIFGLGYVGLAFSTVLTIGALSIAIAHLGGGAQWQTSTFGLQNEVDDYIRGRVFAVDYGLVTLTMSISSVITGVMADHIGAVRATAITASLCIVWALAWGISTRKLWRPLEASYATQKN